MAIIRLPADAAAMIWIARSDSDEAIQTRWRRPGLLCFARNDAAALVLPWGRYGATDQSERAGAEPRVWEDRSGLPFAWSLFDTGSFLGGIFGAADNEVIGNLGNRNTVLL
jgi:hypothetical protein